MPVRGRARWSCVIIPRVGKADAPDAACRAGRPARRRSPATTPCPSIDLTRHVRPARPGELEIAAWDDHPNALGHRRLFLALARDLVKDEATYRLLFPDSPAQAAARAPHAAATTGLNQDASAKRSQTLFPGLRN